MPKKPPSLRRRLSHRSRELSSLATPEYARLQEEYHAALDDCTELQRKFVVVYLATGQPSRACREAGYESSKPDVQGQQILKSQAVARAVKAGREMFAEKYRVKGEELLEELKLIAYSDVNDYEFDADGRPVKSGDRFKWRAVQSIKRRIVPKKDGPPEIHTEIKLHPKVDAIRLLAQHLGLLSGEGADDQVRPPSVIVSGIDPARVAGLPAPAQAAPDVIDAEVVEPDAVVSPPGL